MKLGVIMNVMEEISPRGLCEDWDNTGLLVGDINAEIKKILVCLDATEAVIDEAIEKNCQLIISHHPIIFSGIKKLRTDMYGGRIMKKLLSNGISVFSAHTNFDKAEGGINDILAELIGLTKMKEWKIGEEELIGRIGYLAEPMSIEKFAQKVKAGLNAEYIRYTKSSDKIIKKVALCSGCGTDQISKAAFSGADVYVTGDVKYHEAQRAQELGLHLVDGGHFHTEKPAMRVLAQNLLKRLEDFGAIEVIEATAEKDVFSCIC